MKTTLNISPFLVLELRKQKLLKEYMIWLSMKNTYANSCIYSYYINSTSKKFKRSRYFIKKYISFFLKEGWCYLHEGNLIFVKHTQHPVKKVNKKTLNIHKLEVRDFSLLSIQQAINIWLIKDSDRKQLWAKYPSLRRDNRKLYDYSENGKWRQFTTGRAARVLGVSTSSAVRVLNNLQQQGIIDRFTAPPHILDENFKPLNGKCSYTGVYRESGTKIHTSAFTLVPFKGLFIVTYPGYIKWNASPSERYPAKPVIFSESVVDENGELISAIRLFPSAYKVKKAMREVNLARQNSVFNDFLMESM